MTDIALEDAGCPLNCPRSDEAILTGRDLLHDLPGEFTIVRCRICGLMRTNPRPTPGSMQFYYPDDYGPYLGTQVQAAASRPRLFASLRKVARKLFEFNTTRLPNLPAGRMLEIGCASGVFLHKMAAEGWQVEGIEFSPKAAATARALGYPVHAGSLETAPAPAEPFDLIVGWMVLEHLHDPVLVLKKLKEWIRPGGWLVLSTPNAGAAEARVFQNSWYSLHLPNHLFHYSKKTIRIVLAAAGWQLDKIHFHRVLIDPIASFGYVLRKIGASRLGDRLIKFPQQPGYWLYALYPLAAVAAAIGQTGRMTIWARKAA
jgi:SAM-dependent methyltransferase